MPPDPSPVKGTGVYELRRSYIDSNRLNLGHFLWKKSWPYTTHPSIDISNPNLAVADIGTGTGIWLLELAEQLPPTTTLTGFDVSLHQFPKAHLLPPNVSIKYLDVHEDIPQDLQGKFDVVNMRFMIALVKNQDPGAFLRNVLKLLKPGGWVQWGEADISTQKFLGIEENGVQLEQTAAYRFNKTLFPRAGEDGPWNWPVRLPEVFEKEGLVDIHSERHIVGGASDKYALFGAQTLLAAMHDFALNLPEGEQRQGLQALLAEVEKESLQGIICRAGGIQLVGRKPT